MDVKSLMTDDEVGRYQAMIDSLEVGVAAAESNICSRTTVDDVYGLLGGRIAEINETTAKSWDVAELKWRVDTLEDIVIKLSEVIVNFNNGLYDTDKFLGDLSALFA